MLDTQTGTNWNILLDSLSTLTNEEGDVYLEMCRNRNWKLKTEISRKTNQTKDMDKMALSI